MRTKLKNLLNDSNQEKTFRGGETVNLADVVRREAQFTYAEGEQVWWTCWLWVGVGLTATALGRPAHCWLGRRMVADAAVHNADGVAARCTSVMQTWFGSWHSNAVACGSV